MRRSREFCQRGSNSDDVYFVFLVDEGRADPNTTIGAPSSARQRKPFKSSASQRFVAGR